MYVRHDDIILPRIINSTPIEYHIIGVNDIQQYDRVVTGQQQLYNRFFDSDKDSIAQNSKPVYGMENVHKILENNNYNLTRSPCDGHCPQYSAVGFTHIFNHKY